MMPMAVASCGSLTCPALGGFGERVHFCAGGRAAGSSATLLVKQPCHSQQAHFLVSAENDLQGPTSKGWRLSLGSEACPRGACRAKEGIFTPLRSSRSRLLPVTRPQSTEGPKLL